jgi:hypothetical protein
MAAATFVSTDNFMFSPPPFMVASNSIVPMDVSLVAQKPELQKAIKGSGIANLLREMELCS